MPFRECFGHRRLIAVLAGAVRRDSLPPALLFSGPEGVGKRHVAMALAQALNCPAASAHGPLEIDACGVCPTCQRIARGVHPDVHIVEPGDIGNIKVDQVRDVVDRAGYRPFEGRRRVVVIDRADALIPQAQNALLKTLEEPPAGSVFVLVTARPDVLLPTVRSRCPQLRFQPLADDEVVAALVAAGRTEDQARALASDAEGSIGRALQASGGDVIESREIAVLALEHAAASNEPKRRIEGAKILLAGSGTGGAKDREQLATHLRAMAAVLRDVALLATGASAGRAGVDSDRVAAVTSRSQALRAFRGERGLRAFAAVDQALVALDRYASPKIVADWVLMQL